MSNKNAATEDEIGVLHGLITKCHNLKAGNMLKRANEMLENGEAPEDIVQAINSRDLSSMQKWVEYNGVGCIIAEEDEGSELSKRLNELKEKQALKIVNFEDIKKEMKEAV